MWSIRRRLGIFAYRAPVTKMARCVWCLGSICPNNPLLALRLSMAQNSRKRGQNGENMFYNIELTFFNESLKCWFIAFWRFFVKKYQENSFENFGSSEKSTNFALAFGNERNESNRSLKWLRKETIDNSERQGKVKTWEHCPRQEKFPKQVKRINRASPRASGKTASCVSDEFGHGLINKKKQEIRY